MSLKRNALNKPWCCLCTIIIVAESTYKLILMPAVLPGSPHMSRGREHQKSDLQTLIGPRVKRDWYYLPATPQFSSSCACRPLVAGGRNKQHHPRVAATHVFLVARTRCRRHLFPDPKCSAAPRRCQPCMRAVLLMTRIYYAIMEIWSEPWGHAFLFQARESILTIRMR
jgi:hypothetical protein